MIKIEIINLIIKHEYSRSEHRPCAAWAWRRCDLGDKVTLAALAIGRGYLQAESAVAPQHRAAAQEDIPAAELSSVQEEQIDLLERPQEQRQVRQALAGAAR